MKKLEQFSLNFRIKFLKGGTDLSRSDSDHMINNMFIVLDSTLCFVVRNEVWVLISKKL